MEVIENGCKKSKEENSKEKSKKEKVNCFL
jgi:hypothetical protein